LHPRSPEAHSVFGTGALLLCQPSEMVRVRTCTSVAVRQAPCSFQVRPSAADITPCKLAAQAGFAPTPYRLTGGRTTVIRLSNGAAGRSRTRIDSFRRRMPRLFRPRQRRGLDFWMSGLMRRTRTWVEPTNPPIHSSINPFRKWSARQDLHLRSLGPKPSALAATLRADSPDGCFIRAGETQDTNPGKDLR
jgi:hypothetical protein